MREEVTGAILWGVLVLLAGMVVGRVVLPPLEPHRSYYIENVNERNTTECTLSVNATTTLMGRTKREEVPGIKCGERRYFGRSWLQCRCVPEKAVPE